MRLRTTTIDRMINEAKKLLGIPEWNITYSLGRVPHQAEINLDAWIEQRAHITFDHDTLKKETRQNVYRLVVHEVAHIVIYPICRGASDWVIDRTTNEEYMVFGEAMNTRENEVIGFLMARILKV